MAKGKLLTTQQAETPEVNAEESKPVETTQQAETPEVNAEEMGLSIGVANSSIISSSATNEDVNKGLTKVKISYPEGFKGPKFFKDGDIKFVAKETADAFINKGIAEIVE